MNNQEFREFQRDLRYAALPGKINAGIAKGVIWIVAIGSVCGVLLAVQLVFELISSQGGH